MRFRSTSVLMFVGALLLVSGRLAVNRDAGASDGAVGAAAQQVGGALRVVPMLELWAEARNASTRAEWGRYRAAMDALAQLAPENAQIPVYAADDLLTGPLLAAATREEARAWLRTALEILGAAFERIGPDEHLYEALARFCFELGDAFPFDLAATVAKVADDSELQAMVDAARLAPEFARFEEVMAAHWSANGYQHGPTSGYGLELRAGEEGLLRDMNLLRYVAQYRAACRAAELMNGASSTPLYRVVHAAARLGLLLEQVGQSAKAAEVRREVLAYHRREAQRLRNPLLARFRSSVLVTFASHAEGYLSAEELAANLASDAILDMQE